MESKEKLSDTITEEERNNQINTSEDHTLEQSTCLNSLYTTAVIIYTMRVEQLERKHISGLLFLLIRPTKKINFV